MYRTGTSAHSTEKTRLMLYIQYAISYATSAGMIRWPRSENPMAQTPNPIDQHPMKLNRGDTIILYVSRGYLQRPRRNIHAFSHLEDESSRGGGRRGVLPFPFACFMFFVSS
jgi:hypothetical protein